MRFCGQLVRFRRTADPTIRQPGFDLPRQTWILLNRFTARCYAERGYATATTINVRVSTKFTVFVFTITLSDVDQF